MADSADVVEPWDFVGEDYLRAAGFRPVGENPVNLGIRRLADYNRHARLDYAGLLRGDSRQCVSEQGRMVERYVRYDAEFRGDDVGGVKAPAESYFDYCDVDLLFCKIFEGHGCRQLEKRRMEVVVAESLYEIGHSLGRDHLAIDTDSLSEIKQMGRSV